MRFDKFTLKSQEMIQNAQHLAEKFGHQQIEPEHLARALLEQKEGVIYLFSNMANMANEH